MLSRHLRAITGGALLLVCASAVYAQQTPAPVTPAIPVMPTRPVLQVTPPADDARLATCAAPVLDGFRLYRAESAVPLADLLTGSDALTPVQVAALNCLDDSAWFGVPPAIWLPADALAVADLELLPVDAGAGRASTRTSIVLTSSAGDVIQNREGTQVSWDSRMGEVLLSVCPVGINGQSASCFALQDNGYRRIFPESGALQVDQFWRAGRYEIVAESLERGTETPARSVIVLDVECSNEPLPTAASDKLCPDAPAESITGAVQRFEGGLMLWVVDTGQIFVLTNDNRLRVFTDTYEEGMPDPAAVAPEGLLTPVRGFGRVWEFIGGAENSGLAWALEPETGTTVLRQPIGRTSYATAYLLPDLPDGEFAFSVSQVPGQDSGYWFAAPN